MAGPKITYIGAASSVFACTTRSVTRRERDPLTAAVCSLAEISRMFDEMWAAERAYLAAFE